MANASRIRCDLRLRSRRFSPVPALRGAMCPQCALGDTASDGKAVPRWRWAPGSERPRPGVNVVFATAGVAVMFAVDVATGVADFAVGISASVALMLVGERFAGLRSELARGGRLAASPRATGVGASLDMPTAA
jgi:hypothetical protein